MPVSTALETAVTDLLIGTKQLLKRVHEEWYGGELSWSQISTIIRLERDGPAATADLARAEGVTPQSMGTALAGLEAAGLVQRTPHPTDGRQILYELTEAGVAARRAAAGIKRAWLKRAAAELTPAEQRTLVDAAALVKRLRQL